MAITVTATAQSSGTSSGMVLRVYVLTGAAAAGAQTGATAVQSGAAAHQATITTTVTGSQVYGACLNGAAASPTVVNAATTLVDAIADAGHTKDYATCKATSATGTPGATLLGFTDNNNGGIALFEVLPAGTIAEDASGPAAVSTTGATTLTTAAFTPPPGSLMIALVAANSASNAVLSMQVGDSSGMAWMPVAQANASNMKYAGVFLAQSPGEPGPPPPWQFIPGAAPGEPFAPWPPWQEQPAAAAAPGVPAPPVVLPPAPRRAAPHRARLGAAGALAAGILATGIGPPPHPAPHQPPPIVHVAPHRAQWRGGRGTALVVQAAPIVQAAGTTATVTLAQPTGTGHTLVACVNVCQATTAPSVSGITLGGVADNWQAALTDPGVFTTQAMAGAIWYDPNCASGQTSVVVTLTGGTGTGEELWVAVYEVAAVLAFDQSSHGDVASGATTWSSGSTPTTNAANEIFFGAAAGSTSIPTVTGAGTWATQSNGSGTFDQVAGYQIVSATGTATFSGTQTSGGYVAMVATFSLGPLGPAAQQVKAPVPVTVYSRKPHGAIWRSGQGAVPAALPQPFKPPTVFRRTQHRALWTGRQGAAPGVAQQIKIPVTIFPRPAHRALWHGAAGQVPGARQQVKIPVTVFARPAHRALWRGVSGQAPGAAQQVKSPVPVTVYRRVPHGAVWRSGRGAAPAALPQPFHPATVFTRPAHRVLWRGGAGPAVAAVFGGGAPQPFTPKTVYSRKPHGAAWHGASGAVPTATAQPFLPKTVYARAAHRATWRAIAGPPPPVVVAPALPQPFTPKTIFTRVAHRATWRSAAGPAVPPAPPPPFRPATVFSRKAHGAIWKAAAGKPPSATAQPFKPATVFRRVAHGVTWRAARGAPPAATRQPFRPATVFSRIFHRVLWRAGKGSQAPPPAAIQVARGPSTVTDPRDGTRTLTGPPPSAAVTGSAPGAGVTDPRDAPHTATGQPPGGTVT